jgi:esterase/lipase
MTESSVPGVIGPFHYPGHGPNAGTGVALCHGFTGSPLSILPRAEHLAAQGFAVTVPLLPGHGTDWRELARTTWHDWYDAFEASYLDLSARTSSRYVAGLSMGGALVFTSMQDTIVPPSSLEMIRRRLGSPEFRVAPLPHSGHVATLDVDAQTILEESTTFFLQHAANRVASESS